MTDEDEVRVAYDEPSAEDFEAAEQEDRAKPFLSRLSRALLILVVVAALLLYFIVPAFRGAPFPWPWRDTGVHPLPLAPEPETPPLLGV